MAYSSWSAGAVQRSSPNPGVLSPSRKPETSLALWRKHMAHEHGSEYQVRIVHEDGTDELSGWMNSQEQLAQAMAAVHRAQGKAYWLRERNALCAGCLDTEQPIIVECPIAYTRSEEHTSELQSRQY